jgi:hypothetical protein
MTLLKLLALVGLLVAFNAAIAEPKAKPPGDAAAKASGEPPLPRPRPSDAAASPSPSDKRTASTPVTNTPPAPLPPGAPLTELPPLTDLNAVRQAIELVRKGKHRDASDLARGMKDQEPLVLPPPGRGGALA